MGSDGAYVSIQERTFKYALRIIRLCEILDRRRGLAASVLGRQLLRSGTAIGANVREAESGESRADFLHKIMVAQKEARETLYWLRLIEESRLMSAERLALLIDETDQLIAILSAVAISTKRRGLKRT